MTRFIISCYLYGLMNQSDKSGLSRYPRSLKQEIKQISDVFLSQPIKKYAVNSP